MGTPFFFYYTTKSSILLGNRLVIMTEDGIFNGALVKLQHCRTLLRPEMFSKVKSCLKHLSLPFPLPPQLPFRRPSQFLWLWSLVEPLHFSHGPKTQRLFRNNFCTFISAFEIEKRCICKSRWNTA